jgi:uncharacterized protein (TIGR00251 family)
LDKVIFKEANGAVTFAIKVVPRSSKNKIELVEGDALKIRLTAPPVEGRANAALVKFLAEALGISRAQIEIVSGEKSKQKIVRVSGVSAAQLYNKIAR